MTKDNELIEISKTLVNKLVKLNEKLDLIIKKTEERKLTVQYKT